MVTALLAAGLFSGCKERPEGMEVKGAGHLEDIRVFEVDGCQYVWVKSGYGGGLSHKGNCSGCIARQQPCR